MAKRKKMTAAQAASARREDARSKYVKPAEVEDDVRKGSSGGWLLLMVVVGIAAVAIMVTTPMWLPLLFG